MKSIAKKIAFLFSVLLGLVLFIFVLFQAMPNDEEMLTSQRADAKTKAAIVAELGLDEPLSKQALYYINDLSPLSFYDSSSKKLSLLTGFGLSKGKTQCWIKLPYLRTSFQSKQPVGGMLFQAFIGTMVLAIAAMLLALAIGISLGVWAAMRQGKWVDHIIVGSSAIGISMPSFFSAMLFSWLFGFVWHEYTGLPMTGSLWEIDEMGESRTLMWSNMILPALALGIRPLAVFIQLTRNTMVEMLAQDFVRSAKAKGLSTWQATWKHALPNAWAPIATVIAFNLAYLVVGVVVVEVVFVYPGIGQLMVDAVASRDIPVVQGCALIFAITYILLNLLADIIGIVTNPRLLHPK